MNSRSLTTTTKVTKTLKLGIAAVVQYRRTAALAFCLALCTLGLGITASAQGPTVTTFDAPGAGMGAQQGTYPQSVNEAGAITGWYTDLRFVNHGFVRSLGGTITTFDAPGAGTRPGRRSPPYSGAPAGVVEGYYQDANSVSHGFLRGS